MRTQVHTTSTNNRTMLLVSYRPLLVPYGFLPAIPYMYKDWGERRGEAEGYGSPLALASSSYICLPPGMFDYGVRTQPSGLGSLLGLFGLTFSPILPGSRCPCWITRTILRQVCNLVAFPWFGLFRQQRIRISISPHRI